MYMSNWTYATYHPLACGWWSAWKRVHLRRLFRPPARYDSESIFSTPPLGIRFSPDSWESSRWLPYRAGWIRRSRVCNTIWFRSAVQLEEDSKRLAPSSSRRLRLQYSEVLIRELHFSTRIERFFFAEGWMWILFWFLLLLWELCKEICR